LGPRVPGDVSGAHVRLAGRFRLDVLEDLVTPVPILLAVAPGLVVEGP
jgi:hypothetical protein